MAGVTILGDTILGPQFPDVKVTTARSLSSSRRILRLLFVMAHELWFFNGNLLLLECFLNTVVFEEISACVPEPSPLRNCSANQPVKHWLYSCFMFVQAFPMLFMLKAASLLIKFLVTVWESSPGCSQHLGPCTHVDLGD